MYSIPVLLATVLSTDYRKEKKKKLCFIDLKYEDFLISQVILVDTVMYVCVHTETHMHTVTHRPSAPHPLCATPICPHQQGTCSMDIDANKSV